jgi:hypothetical protein
MRIPPRAAAGPGDSARALEHPEVRKRTPVLLVHHPLHNPPSKLKTLVGFTFARVLDSLRSVKWGAAYIRIKEEVDKEKLIADYGSMTLESSELREIGVKVDQDETFFVDPAITETEPRQVVAGKGGK